MPLDPSIPLRGVYANNTDPQGQMRTQAALAESQQNRQLNQYKLAELVQQQQTEAQIGKLSGQYDLSTPEGQTGYVGALGKISPSRAAEAQTQFLGIREREQKLRNDQNEAAGLAALALADRWDDLRVQGVPEQEIVKQIAPEYRNSVMALGLPKEMLSQIPGNPDYSFLTRVALGSKTGREAYEKRRGENKPQTVAEGSALVDRTGKPLFTNPKTVDPIAAARLVEERRHNLATEGNVGRQKPPEGYRQKSDGTLEFIPGGPADPQAAKRAAPTEDERKAAGWFAQATNAYKNMQAVIRQDRSAAKPGVIESMTPEAIANMSRSPNRQKYLQAASSFAEAALRAATGAGVTKDEANQKIRELTPQLFDSDEVIQQKEESLRVYLSSLQQRAARALSQAPAQSEDYSHLWK